jgi:exodeoxyribonuclease VII small subunit
MERMEMKKRPSDEETPPTFESALQDLESSIRAMEQGQLGLDGTLEAYENAVVKLRFCTQQLAEAERRIELLQGVDSQGNAKSKPFDEGAEELEEKQANRSRRRSV